MTALADFHHSGANLRFVLSGWTSSASRRENSTANGFPWQVGLSQGGGSIFTWRKAGSPGANWSDQRSLSYPPEAGIPALGSQERIGSNQLFLVALAQR